MKEDKPLKQIISTIKKQFQLNMTNLHIRLKQPLITTSPRNIVINKTPKNKSKKVNLLRSSLDETQKSVLISKIRDKQTLIDQINLLDEEIDEINNSKLVDRSQDEEQYSSILKDLKKEQAQKALQQIKLEKAEKENERYHKKQLLLKKIQENEEKLMQRNMEKNEYLVQQRKEDIEKAKEQRDQKRLEMQQKIKQSKKLVQKLNQKTKLTPEQIDNILKEQEEERIRLALQENKKIIRHVPIQEIKEHAINHQSAVNKRIQELESERLHKMDEQMSSGLSRQIKPSIFLQNAIQEDNQMKQLQKKRIIELKKRSERIQQYSQRAYQYSSNTTKDHYDDAFENEKMLKKLQSERIQEKKKLFIDQQKEMAHQQRLRMEYKKQSQLFQESSVENDPQFKYSFQFSQLDISSDRKQKIREVDPYNKKKNYLEEFKNERKQKASNFLNNDKRLLKLVQKNDMSDKEKFEKIRLETEILESKAQAKQKLAGVLETEEKIKLNQEVQNIYLESVKAKLALLQNVNNL